MKKPALINDFLSLLQRSELLSAEDFAALLEREDFSQVSPRQFAKSLVSEGVLTRFQAERLLDGRYRGFFIDRYQLLEVLGVGGMGFVYIARDLSTDQKIALKVLTDVNEVDSGMLTRLQLEARAGMLLDHPNIVKTHRIEQTGAKCVVEMEYVRSVNLHELIALSGPVKWPLACDLILQAAAGLHHAHKAQFVHRDVKPANFLIDKEGQLKVLDFGLALSKDRPDDEFSLAMIFGHDCLGTADFIAPEQIENSLEVDARADIYGLGCTFYAALTGKVPFPFPKNAQKLAAQKNQQPKPILEIIPDVPPEVVAIVERMMAKDPAERFQTAAEVGRALRKWAKRKTMQFSMTEILNIRADHARRKQKSHVTARTSEVTSGSAWTSSNARLSGTLRQQGIETAVARDTLPMTEGSPNVSQPLRVIPLEPTSELAAAVTEQFDSLSSQGPFALVSLDGETSFPLENQHILIGRSGACDVRLDLPGVSSNHCELSFDGMRWHVQDLDSKNGIQINGETVTAAELPVGSKLTIARKHVFRVINLTEPVPSEKRTLLYHAIGWPLLAGLGYLLYRLLT